MRKGTHTGYRAETGKTRTDGECGAQRIRAGRCWWRGHVLPREQATLLRADHLAPPPAWSCRLLVLDVPKRQIDPWQDNTRFFWYLVPEVLLSVSRHDQQASMG